MPSAKGKEDPEDPVAGEDPVDPQEQGGTRCRKMSQDVVIFVEKQDFCTEQNPLKLPCKFCTVFGIAISNLKLCWAPH